MTIYERAIAFGEKAHHGQFRKYTGEPYFEHCIDVAAMAANFLRVDKDHPAALTALLHDTVEDTETSFTDIERAFGSEVADGVFWLTDTITHAQGNRATRCRLNFLRLAAAPHDIKVVKLCDTISNCRSIVEHDPKFAVQYLAEKTELLRLFRSEMELHPAYRVAQAIIDRGIVV